MCAENEHHYVFVELGGTNAQPPENTWKKHGCLACTNCGDTKKVE